MIKKVQGECCKLNRFVNKHYQLLLFLFRQAIQDPHIDSTIGQRMNHFGIHKVSFKNE